MAGNRPARERFEFSLDARQVAGVTLGSLGALGLAFFLGSALGQRVAERPVVQSRAAAPAPGPADPLAALDQAPRPDGGEAAAPLSFHETLTSSRPPPDRLPPAPKAAQPAATQASPPSPPPSAAAATTGPVGSSGPAPAPVAAAPVPAAKPPDSAVPAPAAAKPPAPATKPVPPPKVASSKGAFVVQIGSTQDRFEADRIAARFASRGARVSTADVPGKGRWYRVRLGSFDTREAADRYLKELERSTGAKGFVATAN